MEEFSFKQKVLNKLGSLCEIVKEGRKLGFDFQTVLEKLERIRDVVDDGIVKVVLLGGFSDGKTSAIAGLLGRLESSMKIDPEESSDEIRVYRPLGLKQGFEIVDTPGLFGSKEKEVNGQTVRFSDITKNYISEAHIVVYLCDAVVPLKESHVEIARKVLRDLNKLDSTIFVINKMDETDIDMMDDEEYARGSEIKKKNLIGRLRTSINLTPDEERKLKIVCISADPKGKGIEYWLEKWQDYRKRSRIDSFRKAVNEVIDDTDPFEVKKMTSENAINDMLNSVCEEIDSECAPVETAIVKSEKILKSLQDDSKHLNKTMSGYRNDARHSLKELHDRIISEIDGLNLKTVGSYIEKEIGVQTNEQTKKTEVTFWILGQNINQIFDVCGANNQSAFSLMDKKVDFEGKFTESVKIVDDAIKGSLEQGCAKGAKKLGSVKLNNKMILNARNTWFKNYKFKPHGAVNMAKKLNVWAERLSKALENAPAVIAALIEVYSWCRDYSNQKELGNIKSKMKNVINDVFASYEGLMSDENYFKNFAPEYVDLLNKIKEQQEHLDELQGKIQELRKYKDRYEKWVQDNVQDAEMAT